MNKNKFTIGVFGLIFNSNYEILLCHRTDKDLWNLPGGGLEPGETLLQGVIREVQEETGFAVSYGQLVGVYTKSYDKSDMVFTYLCLAVTGVLTVNAEADRFLWCRVNTLPTNIIPNHVQRIKDGLAIAKSQPRTGPIYYRVQDGPPSNSVPKTEIKSTAKRCMRGGLPESYTDPLGSI